MKFLQHRTLAALVCVWAVAASAGEPKPTVAYDRESIGGFTILVSDELAALPEVMTDVRAELVRQIAAIRQAVPDGPLAALEQVVIWVEWNAKPDGGAEFHPSVEWLRDHGYNPEKARCIEISNARNFVAWSRDEQPCMVMHELAHAYHFRVLGHRHAGIAAAYEKAIDEGRYDAVRHVAGGTRPAYAKTDDKEYFAELSEAYFGSNDFAPFDRVELERHDPTGYAVLREVWGEPRDVAASAQGPRQPVVAEPLAVETIEFPDLIDASRGGPEAPPRDRRVPIKVHLPAGGGPYPVVVVSHGAGGDWDTHRGHAVHLASHGYAVLCLEHVGSNRDRLTGGLQSLKDLAVMTRDAREVLGRPRDVSFAIDSAAEWNRSHATLRGRLDLDRIGAMGHSFGAFTTMVVCGMRPAVDWLTPRVGTGKGLGPSLRDPRVACGVALSPQGVGEPFFIRESFGSLQVPLLGVTGSQDRQQGGLAATARREAFALWPKGEHRLVWLTNARHIDFTDSTGSPLRPLPSPTRDDVQPVLRAALRLFFDAQLKDDAEAAAQLTAVGLRPYLRGAVNDVEVLTK